MTQGSYFSILLFHPSG